MSLPNAHWNREGGMRICWNVIHAHIRDDATFWIKDLAMGIIRNSVDPPQSKKFYIR
jgi:hypothetical protein